MYGVQDGHSIRMIPSCLRIDTAAAVPSYATFRSCGSSAGGRRAGVQGGARQAAARPTRRPAARSVRPTRAVGSERRRARAAAARHRALVKVFSRPRGTSARASSVSYVTVLHPWKQGGRGEGDASGLQGDFSAEERRRQRGRRRGKAGRGALACTRIRCVAVLYLSGVGGG